MASKNGARHIREQIDSILPQLTWEDEIIISDDGSCDHTKEIVLSYNDKRIKLYDNTSKKGIIKNFENSLTRANGDFIFLADQDDVWLPDKIEKMSRKLREFDLAICDCYLADESLQIAPATFFNQNRSRKGLLKNLYRNSYMGCCMGFKRKVLNAALPFPADIPMHDFWIGLVAELNFSITFLGEPLVIHRMHKDNASSTGRDSAKPLHEKLSSRYRLVKNLILHQVYAE